MVLLPLRPSTGLCLHLEPEASMVDLSVFTRPEQSCFSRPFKNSRYISWSVCFEDGLYLNTELVDGESNCSFRRFEAVSWAVGYSLGTIENMTVSI